MISLRDALLQAVQILRVVCLSVFLSMSPLVLLPSILVLCCFLFGVVFVCGGGFFKFFAVRLLSSLASGSCVLGYGNHLYVEQLRKGMTPSVCTSFTRMNEINAFQL